MINLINSLLERLGRFETKRLLRCCGTKSLPVTQEGYESFIRRTEAEELERTSQSILEEARARRDRGEPINRKLLIPYVVSQFGRDTENFILYLTKNHGAELKKLNYDDCR